MSYSFWDSGIWRWLTWVVLSQSPSCICWQDIGQGCGLLKAWLGLKNSLPDLLTCFFGMPQFLPGSWPEASFSYPLGKPIGYLSVLMTWQLASPRESDSKESRDKDKEATVFCNLISEMSYHHFCHLIRITQTNCVNVGRSYTRVWIPGG